MASLDTAMLDASKAGLYVAQGKMSKEAGFNSEQLVQSKLLGDQCA